MKKITTLLAIFISALFILTSCGTNSTRPQVPKDTIGSINFIKSNNKFKVIVLNKNGKPFDIRTVLDKKAQQSADIKQTSEQQSNEVRLFFVDGSCVVKVCLPRRPCQPVTIDDDEKCAELGL